ncbi:MAG: hypothetical protein ACYCWW_16325 [Deltaproteobacteria bacterium]
MTRLTPLALALTVALGPACDSGACLSKQRRERLRALVGVSTSELGIAAIPPRLQSIAKDMAATDPATKSLGLAECLWLQERARTLAREATTLLPLLAAPEDRLSAVSADLSAAIGCDAPIDPAALAPRLRKDQREVMSLLRR